MLIKLFLSSYSLTWAEGGSSTTVTRSGGWVLAWGNHSSPSQVNAKPTCAEKPWKTHFPYPGMVFLAVRHLKHWSMERQKHCCMFCFTHHNHRYISTENSEEAVIKSYRWKLFGNLVWVSSNCSLITYMIAYSAWKAEFISSVVFH